MQALNSQGWCHRLFLVGTLALGGDLAIVPASAQTPAPVALSVSLVLQDFSDCQNGNVMDDDGIKASGTIWLTRNGDGTTSLKVGVTVKPNTTYHFFLKCVRLLGDIKTDDEGIGGGEFTFPTNAVGNVYGFDMYPEGAPAGNKFQSVQVKFQ